MMKFSATLYHRLVLTLACLFACLWHLGSAQQVFACDPSNVTNPIPCAPGHWISVTAEFYAPQVAGSRTGGGALASCQQESSNCNTALFSAGLKTNCNGPVGPEPCREEVDVSHAKELMPCLNNVTEVATIVQYSCVKDEDVLDLCDTSTRLTSAFSTSAQMKHLASPGFPSSSSSGKLCTCTLQGSKLRVRAVEVSVASRLPWQNDVTDGSHFEAVLAIRSNGNTLFKSNDCVGCSSVTIMNTILVSTGFPAVSELTITYSDFGLQDQNVWLEITELGPDFNITCSSTPLPTNRLITTTTIPTTTTTTTTDPSNTAGAAAIPAVPTATTKRPITNNRGPAGGKGRPVKDDGGDSGDSATVVVLVVLLILLLVAGGILGVFLYRRRGQCGADGKKGLKPMIRAWYRDLQCCVCLARRQRSPGDGQDADNDRIETRGFDGPAMVSGGEDRDGDSRRHQGVTNPAFSGDSPHHTRDRHAPTRRKVEVIQTEDGEMTIFHNEVYQAHRELVEEEVARMKQNKREQRAQGLNGTGLLKNSRPSDYPSDKDTLATGDVQTTSFNDNIPMSSTKRRDSGNAEVSKGSVPLDHEYETIKSLEPDLDSHSHNTSYHPGGTDAVQDGYLYEDIKASDSLKTTSPQKGRNLKNQSSDPDGAGSHVSTNLPKSHHHKHRSRPAPDSAHSGSERSVISGASDSAASSDKDGRALSPPTHELLSPEERDMFAALGLAGGDDLHPSSHDDLHLHPSPHVSDTDHTETPGRGASRGHSRSQPDALADREDKSLSDDFETTHTSVKTKKAPRPELVSDILEVSLRDIKNKRTGPRSDEGSDGAEDEAVVGEAVYLGSRESQVKMSEC